MQLHLGFRLPPLPKTLPSSNFTYPNFPSKDLHITSRVPAPSRRRIAAPSRPPNRPDLRRLTSRIVELTRRKQLDQVLEEVERAKKRHGRLNTIVMNAVVEACVRCGDVEAAFRVFSEMSGLGGPGVDEVTFATLLKGLGEARRVDEAFQMLEAVEKGTAAGSVKLSPPLIYGLLNALLEAGDMRRAHGLLARYRPVLQEENPTTLLYNMLMKGYTNSDSPLKALSVTDEMLRHGLKPDRLTYNTLIFACTKSGDMVTAMQFLAEMKVSKKYLNIRFKDFCSSYSLFPDVISQSNYTVSSPSVLQDQARICNSKGLLPNAVTYTTLLKGSGNMKDLISVQNIVVEMKSLPNLFIDRTAYTAMVDALLVCGSTTGALCIFGDMIKRAGENKDLRPKPHLFLAMMRAFALKGDFDMVKMFNVRMLPDSVGGISHAAKLEADELLMEAALNNGQVVVARQILSSIVNRQEGISWTSRGGMVAVRIEASSGCHDSTCSPYILPEVSFGDPIDKYMTAFEDAEPLHASVSLRGVLMRFYRDAIVPVVDDWGNCVGIVHHEDCNELDAPLSKLMRGPPPCVTTSTSVGRVIDLLLEKKYKMIIIVRSNDFYESSYSSASRAVGVFALEQLSKLTVPVKQIQEPSLHRTFPHQVT
ncbi:Pentatricopeptide repeat-containing protein [Acorus gramineus]|uniref:Pentatricopeptide repeat-containing protein n=1 Tax=Acorus gramineus TaxID=55184 RepID=A0AAV9BG47_ACOGR|nr:Pentatricopeptide repeat-containing protein [Acorus gramineus]